MRGEDFGVAEGLRGLHTAQFLTRRGGGHHLGVGGDEAVDHRKDGNGSGVMFERGEQAGDYLGAGNRGARHRG